MHLSLLFGGSAAVLLAVACTGSSNTQSNAQSSGGSTSAGGNANAGAGGTPVAGGAPSGGVNGAGGSGAVGGTRTCPVPAASALKFATEAVRPVATTAKTAAIFLAADGGPWFVYQDADSNNQRGIWAAPRATVSDGSVTDVALRLSRGTSGGQAVDAPSVRVARGGGLRLSYPELVVGNTVRYVEWSGDANQDPVDVVADSTGAQSFSAALALDAQDQPFVAFFDALSDATRLASRVSGSWQSETVTSGALPITSHISLTVDGAGDVLLFAAGGPGLPILTASIRHNGVWSREVVDAGDTDDLPRSGLDAAGRVNVFFISQDGLWRAVRQSATWDVSKVVDTLGDFALRATDGFDVAFATNGDIHLVASSSGVLTYARFDGCSLASQAVEQQFGARTSPVIAVDASGKPHIGYQNGDKHELWYAHVQ